MNSAPRTRNILPPAIRFWPRVDQRGPDECWNWTGAIRANGYGHFSIRYKSVLAHRFVYELRVGPIPPGLQLDHLCRNRRCVNPRHLEPVTCRENSLRSPISCMSKTHCKRGHPLSGPNLFRDTRGHRQCRKCAALKASRFRARHKGGA